MRGIHHGIIIGRRGVHHGIRLVVVSLASTAVNKKIYVHPCSQSQLRQPGRMFCVRFRCPILKWVYHRLEVMPKKLALVLCHHVAMNYQCGQVATAVRFVQ